MPNDPRLEQYLSSLDKALGQIPVGDRSDIITEIKSHILDSVDRNPDQNMNQILASLGEPETVANRYLLERGLKTGRPSKSPMVKWLTIGFLGTLGLVLLFSLIVILNFSPIIKIDEQSERVTILGGLIDIDGKGGKLNVDGFSIEPSGQRINGSQNLKGSSVKTIALNFKNGRIEVKSSGNDEVRWDCQAHKTGKITEEGDKFVMNFTDGDGVKCELFVPKSVALTIEGGNGRVSFDEIDFPVDLRLGNGRVSFEQNKKIAYRFETNIVNGRVDGLESSRDANAIPVKLSLTNGRISGE